MADDELAVGLFCFEGSKTAGAAHRAISSRLRSSGDRILETTILRVDGKGRASVHDPQRVLQGTLTSALTWGAFGLVAGTDRVKSAIIWAVLGAICGGIYAYASEHLLTKAELARIGRHIPGPSSALIMYAQTIDPKHLLESAAPAAPTVGSVAAIGSDLSTRAYAGTGMPVELPHGSPASAAPVDEGSLTAMVLVRYPDPKTARRIATKAVKSKSSSPGRRPLQVELVVETPARGGRRVLDPTHGVSAMAKSDVISWGAFGLVFGAVVGLSGGGGILGFLSDGIATGIGWGVFGLAAGALYGLWAGRSVSARRLRGLGCLLPVGSSALLAWSDGPARPSDLEVFEAVGAERLVLAFNPVHGGAVLGPS